jgi:hypothetical protein
MSSLTQCMVHGGLGSNETILDVAPCAKHHSLLLSYLFNLKRGLAFVRDMIIADLRSSIDIGARQQAADLLVVLRFYFRRVSGSRVRSAVAACQRKIAVKQEPVSLRPFSPPNL